MPYNPDKTYSNFPGWIIFLGRKEQNFYSTWQDASKAAIKLGFKNIKEYTQNYKKDLRLPCSPYQVYPDFPGFKKFLGKK